MKTKGMLQGFVVFAILLSSFTSTGRVSASYNCASYITVQWGDTLSGLAAYCGTTVSAIRAANPGLGWWVYAGQVLYIPTGYGYYPDNPGNYPPATGGYYTVRRGDTLGNIAAAYGVSLGSLIKANPQIWNPSLIYPGQVINVPTSYVPPAPPPVVVTPPVTTPPAGYEGVLTVIAGKGVNIRNQPSYTGKIVVADDYTRGVTYYYRLNSVTYDTAYNRVWVEVVISRSGNTVTTGWLPVSGPKDYLNHTGPIEDWVTPHIQ
jgi:spore coat assembly protein SafA